MQEGLWQYVLSRDGTEVERGEPDRSAFFGIMVFGDFIGPQGVIPDATGPVPRPCAGKAAPGKYRLSLESRYLVTELVGPAPPKSIDAPRLPVGRIVTLVSDPVAVGIQPPAPPKASGGPR